MMFVRSALVAMLFAPLIAQDSTDDFHVYRDPPRLLLTPQRLRLVQLERESDSVRWAQFDSARREVAKWWRGKPAIPREQRYALFDLLHAFRGNLKTDLRESDAVYFKDLPTDHVAGHYPAPFPGPENDFRIPAFLHEGDPN